MENVLLRGLSGMQYVMKAVRFFFFFYELICLFRQTFGGNNVESGLVFAILVRLHLYG